MPHETKPDLRPVVPNIHKFFLSGCYRSGVWQTARVLNDRWRTAKDEEVPRKLRSAKRVKKEMQYAKEKSKGRYKEK